MEKDNALKIPLREQENLKELFHLLEQNGMAAEKKQVLQMADYIDDMETKMELVLKDLKEMREQISGIARTMGERERPGGAGRDGKRPPSAGDDGPGTASSAESNRLDGSGDREAGRYGRRNV